MRAAGGRLMPSEFRSERRGWIRARYWAGDALGRDMRTVKVRFWGLAEG